MSLSRTFVQWVHGSIDPWIHALSTNRHQLILVWPTDCPKDPILKLLRDDAYFRLADKRRYAFKRHPNHPDPPDEWNWWKNLRAYVRKHILSTWSARQVLVTCFLTCTFVIYKTKLVKIIFLLAHTTDKAGTIISDHKSYKSELLSMFLGQAKVLGFRSSKFSLGCQIVRPESFIRTYLEACILSRYTSC